MTARCILRHHHPPPDQFPTNMDLPLLILYIMSRAPPHLPPLPSSRGIIIAVVSEALSPAKPVTLLTEGFGGTDALKEDSIIGLGILGFLYHCFGKFPYGPLCFTLSNN